METVCIVRLRYGDIWLCLGVFEDELKAKDFLYNHKCVQREYYIPPLVKDLGGGKVDRRDGRIIREVVATEEFLDWLRKGRKGRKGTIFLHKFFCHKLASPFRFSTIGLNTIARGHNED